MKRSTGEQRLIEHYRQLGTTGQQILEAVAARFAGGAKTALPKPRAVSLREACSRLGMSYATGRRKIAEGTFPVPALPRHGREWHRFSDLEIDRYLADASTADA